MKVFIAPLWVILALLMCLNSNAQDIIYTISGEINSQKTPLDSIAVENLSKQSTAGFGDLPERDDYRINLSRDEYWGSTSVNDRLNQSGLQIIKNLPGTLVVGYRGNKTLNTNISLHNNNGQRLAFKENQLLENGTLVEVEIGNAGIYFLTISSPEETRSFKSTGMLAEGNMSIATQSGAPLPLKSGQAYTLAGTGTEKGDNVKVSVFKLGYVAQSVELTVNGNETLVFPLEAQTPPVVETLEASNIQSISATLNGNVVSEGNSPITERGFYWSATSENPGEADSIVVVEGTTGSFSAELTRLKHATTYYVRAYAANAIVSSYGETKSFTTIAFLPTVTTTAITDITQTTATSGGKVTSDGGASVTERGVCWNTTGNPTISDSKTSNGTGTGGWVSELVELQSNTTYYLRAYATNSQGAAFGEQFSFKTKALTVPTVKTISIANITQTTAIGSGNITSDGGAAVTERGFCWNTTLNPTIADSKTTNETGTGNFTSNLTGLQANTTYYVRAYATNNIGTAYGWQIRFNTLSLLVEGDETEIIEVVNPITGKTWMDRNLGATRAATSSTDSEAYGDLYQWGRAADGHQKRNSSTNTTLSTSDNPGHGSFILAPGNPYDWRSSQNDNLWQGVNGTNNPCPSGYRLPTISELDAERQYWGWRRINAAGAFASPLKLPVAGWRDGSDGSLNEVGYSGSYWSSTVDGIFSRFMYFISSDASTNGGNSRGYSFSVRCLKD